MRGISKRSMGLLACAACLAALPGGAAAKTGSPPVDLTNADHCDFIGQQQGSLCLLPFPDDYYTVPDAGTATGLRINLKTEATPANVAGQRVDTAPYNLNDGFSPGQTIVVKVPGLDSVAAMQRTGAVPINHIGQYARPDQPIVVIDATTGKRWPIWSEIDSNATDPNRAALLIHPAVQLRRQAPLHRRPARPADRRRPGDPGPERLPLLPRQAALRGGGDQPAPRPLQEHLQDAAKGAHQAQGPLPRLGLHGLQRREHRRPDASHPQRRLRPARRHQPRRPCRGWGSAAVQRHQRAELHGGREPQPRPPRAGNVHRALLPAPRLRARGHLPARFQRAADPQRQLDRQLHLHHPPRRDRSRRQAVAALPLRTWPARQRRGGRLYQPADTGAVGRHHLLRHRSDRLLDPP